MAGTGGPVAWRYDLDGGREHGTGRRAAPGAARQAVACVTATSAAAFSRSGRGPFAGLPREAAILSAVSFTVALGYGIVAPAIPAFARQFGVGVAAAASVISAFALMRIVFALPAGRLADRFGSR